MNVRIKGIKEQIWELAEQAGGFPCSQDEWGFYNKDLEKFAKLIVRECADIADFCDQVESVEAVSSVLKRHFGIKGDEREQVLGLGEDS